MKKNNRIFPNWKSFEYKYRGREQDAFEDLARTLFRKEMGIKYGLFQRINHKGNETDIVEKEGKVCGFQAKFFDKRIDADNIISSMRDAKESHPEQTHYYIYCNLAFGNPQRRKGAKKTDPIPNQTLAEEKINRTANELGLTIVWKMDRAILDEANEETWIDDVFFCVESRLEALIGEERQHSEIAFNSINYTCLLLEHNIGVYFINDNINTFYPDSEFRLTLMASIAQDELRKLSESVKFGLNQSIKRGIVLGNNNILGYTKNKGKLIINKKESLIVKDIYNLYLSGIHNYSKITKIINTKYNKNLDSSTTKRILTNYKYKGYYCGKKTEVIDYKKNKRKPITKDNWIIYKDLNQQKL